MSYSHQTERLVSANVSKYDVARLISGLRRVEIKRQTSHQAPLTYFSP